MTIAISRRQGLSPGPYPSGSRGAQADADIAKHSRSYLAREGQHEDQEDTGDRGPLDETEHHFCRGSLAAHETNCDSLCLLSAMNR